MTKTAAILGASPNRSKFGNKSLRAHVRAGWTVYPIHPTAQEVEGLEVFPTLSDLPEKPHRISIYLPPAVTRSMLPEIQAAGAEEVWLNPGAADTAVLTEAQSLGIPVIDGCSIVDLGLSPSQFPD